MKRFPEKYTHLVFGAPPIHNDYLVYLCPVCLKNCLAVEKGTMFASYEFSEDLFPPASVGGKLTVLVCKSCNNAAGCSYEGSLQKKLEQINV